MRMLAACVAALLLAGCYEEVTEAQLMHKESKVPWGVDGLRLGMKEAEVRARAKAAPRFEGRERDGSFSIFWDQPANLSVTLDATSSVVALRGTSLTDASGNPLVWPGLSAEEVAVIMPGAKVRKIRGTGSGVIAFPTKVTGVVYKATLPDGTYEVTLEDDMVRSVTAER